MNDIPYSELIELMIDETDRLKKLTPKEREYESSKRSMKLFGM